MSKDQTISLGGVTATMYMGQQLEFPDPPPVALIDDPATDDPYEVIRKRTYEALNELDAYVDGRSRHGMQPVYDAIELLQDQLAYIDRLVDQISGVD